MSTGREGVFVNPDFSCVYYTKGRCSHIWGKRTLGPNRPCVLNDPRVKDCNVKLPERNKFYAKQV